jgi:ABC-type transporter Mla MlaB component
MTNRLVLRRITTFQESALRMSSPVTMVNVSRRDSSVMELLIVQMDLMKTEKNAVLLLRSSDTLTYAFRVRLLELAL